MRKNGKTNAVGRGGALLRPAGYTELSKIFGESVCTYPLGRRGRCPHRPTQTAPILRKSSANSKLPDGPMWASAPTAACANAYEFAENQYKICSALLHDLSDSASPSHLPFQGRLGCGSICFSSDTPAPDRAPSARSGSCSLHCVRPAGLRSMESDTAHGCAHRTRDGQSRC